MNKDVQLIYEAYLIQEGWKDWLTAILIAIGIQPHQIDPGSIGGEASPTTQTIPSAWFEGPEYKQYNDMAYDSWATANFAKQQIFDDKDKPYVLKGIVGAYNKLVPHGWKPHPNWKPYFEQNSDFFLDARGAISWNILWPVAVYLMEQELGPPPLPRGEMDHMIGPDEYNSSEWLNKYPSPKSWYDKNTT